MTSYISIILDRALRRKQSEKVLFSIFPWNACYLLKGLCHIQGIVCFIPGEICYSVREVCYSLDKLCFILRGLCNIPKSLCNIVKSLCNIPREICYMPKEACYILRSLCHISRETRHTVKCLCKFPEELCDMPGNICNASGEMCYTQGEVCCIQREPQIYRLINHLIINAMLTQKKYPCTQRELYAVCTSGWESCSQHIEQFSSYRPIYTPAYVEVRQGAIRAASLLPDKHERLAEQELARTALKRHFEDLCVTAWKKLKGAIREIWPEEEYEACFKAIGQPVFREASQHRWESCSNLMDNAENFIKANSDRLLASNHLEKEFPDNFKILGETLRKLISAYSVIQEKVRVAAEEKTKANNELYKDLMTLFEDARILFKKDPVTMKKFAFETKLMLVSGQNSAGIKGSISIGQVPISDVHDLLLSLTENGDEAFVDKDGSYRFSQLAAGTYTMQVSATGYKSQTIPGIVVNTGAYSIRTVLLEKDGGI